MAYDVGVTEEHQGDNNCYVRGCRLPQCTEAHRLYERNGWRERNRPDGARRRNRRVKPTKAVEHLVWLASRGIGYKRVAELTGLAEPTIRLIRQGKRKYIMSDVERRIMGVGTHAAKPYVLVPVDPVADHVERLLDAGWTATKIAKQAGVHRNVIVHIAHGDQEHVRSTTATRIRAIAA